MLASAEEASSLKAGDDAHAYGRGIAGLRWQPRPTLIATEITEFVMPNKPNSRWHSTALPPLSGRTDVLRSIG